MNAGKNEYGRACLSSLEMINVYFLIRPFKKSLRFGEGSALLLLIGKVFENISQEKESEGPQEEKPS
jgi:hypothetical protein